MNSLLETIIWVALIVWLVLKFEKSITEILGTLRNRIESGGNVKIGPLELTEPKPQEPSKQVARKEAELKELIESQSTPEDASETIILKTNYLMAEELAVRALEAEFEQSIQRQVSWGSDQGFDGFFAFNYQAQIVEVKYFTKRIDYERIKIALARTQDSYHKYNWENVRIIFVVVAEEAAFKSISESNLARTASEVGANVLFRCYSLKTLEAKFGA